MSTHERTNPKDSKPRRASPHRRCQYCTKEAQTKRTSDPSVYGSLRVDDGRPNPIHINDNITHSNVAKIFRSNMTSAWSSNLQDRWQGNIDDDPLFTQLSFKGNSKSPNFGLCNNAIELLLNNIIEIILKLVIFINMSSHFFLQTLIHSNF